MNRDNYSEAQRDNPSRWTPAPDDNREAMVPFRTKSEYAAEQAERLENDVLNVIGKVFELDLRAIKRATQLETGRYRLSTAGFQAAVHPPFPARLAVMRPSRTKGDVFTLNRMLKDPSKFYLFSEFFRQLKVETDGRPVMLIGVHPRIVGYIAVTNLELEPDLLCFRVCVQEEGIQYPLLFGEFHRILQAMKDQNFWSPQLDGSINL
jgi:hypothetical protein